MSAPDQAISTALAALNTLYHDPDTDAKKRANEWLQEFQHSVDAWQTCHALLNTPDSPLEARLFASQTFRTKILYDLKDIPQEQLFPLRDSLLAALTPLSQPSAPAGSRAVLLQLCIALADFGLQVSAWEDPVGDMIEKFGKDPSTVRILLDFLKSWIEEAMNPHVQLGDGPDRVGGSVEQVITVLSMYLQAPGITPQIQILVFQTLGSWLGSGDLLASQVAQTPLFNAAFEALEPDETFDSAVDVLCDLIHETQEINDNMEVIQQIIPRLIALQPRLEQYQEDADRIRGYCRLFSEAGEWYNDLIVRHPADLLPLVHAIAQCAAYPDLEIVPITFNFWYALAVTLGRQPTDPSVKPLLDIFEQLQTTIIRHLHFPQDNEEQTAQERDEFRSFRHRMGDTLKDCCRVLGAEVCLKKSYDLIVEVLSKGSPTWQEIEAPLFSMRSMGAEVSPNDDEVMPHIMELLPKLPDHPRVRYAAILVIGRYTAWISRHPENLAFQLEYVSSGFNMTDEVSAAAAQGMKFLCQDCTEHLVPFLPQLHSFITTLGDRLDPQDMVEVCEAIGYVIEGMPAVQAAPALRQFVEPLMARVQVVVKSSAEASKQDLQKVADALEQIDALLSIVRTLNPVPEECYATIGPMFTLLDQLLERYGKLYYLSERVSTIFRRGLAFFPVTALQPYLEAILRRNVSSFIETNYSSYLWIVGKTASKFTDVANAPEGQETAALLNGAFIRMTDALTKVVAVKTATAIPDVMDDYIHCFMSYLNNLPVVTLSSPALQHAFVLTLLSLSCPAPHTIAAALDVLALLAQRMSHAPFQPILQPIFASSAKDILLVLLQGVVQNNPEESLDHTVEVITATVQSVPAEDAERWATEAIAAVPGHVLPVNVRAEFISQLHNYLQAPGTDQLKTALLSLVRAARTARERGRQARKNLGA